jgi:hypothetical protein
MKRKHRCGGGAHTKNQIAEGILSDEGILSGAGRSRQNCSRLTFCYHESDVLSKVLRKKDFSKAGERKETSDI